MAIGVTSSLRRPILTATTVLSKPSAVQVVETLLNNSQ